MLFVFSLPQVEGLSSLSEALTRWAADVSYPVGLLVVFLGDDMFAYLNISHTIHGTGIFTYI